MLVAFRQVECIKFNYCGNYVEALFQSRKIRIVRAGPSLCRGKKTKKEVRHPRFRGYCYVILHCLPHLFC